MRERNFGNDLYLRNFVFGIEDGLVSTVGLLSGIAIAGVPRATILLTGVVLIFVEAVSMAAGSFLSEASVDELSGDTDKVAEHKSFAAGAVMFVSYFIAGFIPLFPYQFFRVESAFPISVACSFLALFALGYWSGKATRHVWRKASRMALVGGAAIFVGIFVGGVLS